MHRLPFFGLLALIFGLLACNDPKNSQITPPAWQRAYLEPKLVAPSIAYNGKLFLALAGDQQPYSLVYASTTGKDWKQEKLFPGLDGTSALKTLGDQFYFEIYPKDTLAPRQIMKRKDASDWEPDNAALKINFDLAGANNNQAAPYYSLSQRGQTPTMEGADRVDFADPANLAPGDQISFIPQKPFLFGENVFMVGDLKNEKLQNYIPAVYQTTTKAQSTHFTHSPFKSSEIAGASQGLSSPAMAYGGGLYFLGFAAKATQLIEKKIFYRSKDGKDWEAISAFEKFTRPNEIYALQSAAYLNDRFVLLINRWNPGRTEVVCHIVTSKDLITLSDAIFTQVACLSAQALGGRLLVFGEDRAKKNAPIMLSGSLK